MKLEFTASIYILENERVLLIHHKKLNKWLPAGGHIHANETPPEAAVREAFEETGFEVELMEKENVWIKHHNAASIKRPYLCLLEEIPPFKHEPAHQHVDFVFVGYPINGALKHNPAETNQVRWFSYDELLKFTPEVDIFQETLDVLESIFQTFVHNFQKLSLPKSYISN